MTGDVKLDALREKVKNRLSEKRFLHTLGVERLAKTLGELVLPELVSELCSAALLHDIAKELSDKEQLSLIGDALVGDDFDTPAVYHALAAPAIIKRDFPEYATENILSAVKNHTTGAPDMTIFDRIIFLSDFAEDGREYPACRAVAKRLFEHLDAEKTKEEKVEAINASVIDTLNATLDALKRIERPINHRTLLTISAFADKI